MTIIFDKAYFRIFGKDTASTCIGITGCIGIDYTLHRTNLSSTFSKSHSGFCGFGYVFSCVGLMPRRRKVLDL